MRWLLAALVLALSPRVASAAPCEERHFEGSRFTVCEYYPIREELRLVLADARGDPLRSFRRLRNQLGADGRRVQFAMNAGMFGADGNPIGLYVEDGTARHPLNTADGSGNFYMKPNGVFFVDDDGTPNIATTEDFQARRTAPRFATQSGPMLLIDGLLHPQIAADGPSTNIRNGVGLRDENTALFAISDNSVSFGRFARLFRDLLHCRDALYLDGAISSAWIPAQLREDHRTEFGPMVVVLEKK